MALTLDEVRRQIDLDEPDYRELARRLGPESLPHLRTLAEGADEGVAAKAVHLSALLPSAESPQILATAARSQHEVVRIAAAAAAAQLHPAEADQVLARLLDDQDVGIRKVAVRSAAKLGVGNLRPKLEEIQRSDPEPRLRHLATQALRR